MHHTPIKYKSLGIIIYIERVNLYLCVHAKSLQSCPTLCNPKGYSPPGSSVHGYFPCKNAGVGCHAFLQGIFLTQDLTRVSCISCIAGGFFTHWATWEAQYTYIYMYILTYTYIYMYIYIYEVLEMAICSQGCDPLCLNKKCFFELLVQRHYSYSRLPKEDIY